MKLINIFKLNPFFSLGSLVLGFVTCFFSIIPKNLETIKV